MQHPGIDGWVHTPNWQTSLVHVLPSLKHVVPSLFLRSEGHEVDAPSQTSAISHPDESAARQMAPAFPGLCTHVPDWHTSVVQIFPSS